MNPLIYGKNELKNIVSVEVIDDTAELFLQNENGDVEVTYVPNKYYILAHEQPSDRWVKLDGDLYYKYAKTYNRRIDYFKDKNLCRSKEMDIFAFGDEKESFLVKNGYTYFKGMKPSDITVLSFDIETTGLYHDENAKILIISNTFRKKGQIIRKMFCYDEYESQGEMLQDWCKWVREVDPSVMLGHNIYSFDLKYMQFIADRENISLHLGRNNSPMRTMNYESFKRIDGSRKQAYNKVRIYGREVIDTMFMAINYDIGKKYESYGLKKIIAHEKMEAIDRVFYDASQIRFKYTDPVEWAKIKAYCADDSDDSLKLFDLMSAAMFYFNQSVPKSFQAMVESASGSQLNSMMIRSYLQIGHSIPKTTEVNKYEGAISYGKPGIYRNCFKVDVASLYPSIMIQYEVYNKAKDPKAHMLQMVKTFTDERLKNKHLSETTGDKYFDDLQNSQKIAINSFYGFLGAEGLNFNYAEGAAFVTEKGREILQKSIKWSCGFELIKSYNPKNPEDFEWIEGIKEGTHRGFELVNCDTDSITIYYPDFKDMDDNHRKETLQSLNSIYPERIRFADDGFFKTIIVLKAKNYVLYGWNKKKQIMEIKTKGSALKDAKKEKALKEFLNKIIDMIIKDEKNFNEIYMEYVKEILNIKDITRWSSKKTISSKVLTSERANESKVRDAIEGSEIVEGDKVWVYFKSDDTLGLAEKFNGDYHVDRMLEKLYKTSETFKNVLPEGTFKNFKLKRNKSLLEEISPKKEEVPWVREEEWAM